MYTFDYRVAGSLSELVTLLADPGRRIRVLAGGTDLLVQLREGRGQADLLVDVKRIPELLEISYHASSGLRIGAAVSCAVLSSHPVVREHYPGLVEAAGLIGGVQIQSRASLGGNLCNASPAADAIPALIVHAAACQVVGPQGLRSLPVEDFCLAPGKNCLDPGEALVALYLPPPPPGFGAAYLRFTPRNEMDIAVVGAGAALFLDEDRRTIRQARLALGAVAPTPLFVREVGEFLAGKAADALVFQQAAELAQAAARPIDDLRGTIAQRRQLSRVLSQRVLARAFARARG